MFLTSGCNNLSHASARRVPSAQFREDAPPTASCNIHGFHAAVRQRRCQRGSGGWECFIEGSLYEDGRVGSQASEVDSVRFEHDRPILGLIMRCNFLLSIPGRCVFSLLLLLLLTGPVEYRLHIGPCSGRQWVRHLAVQNDAPMRFCERQCGQRVRVRCGPCVGVASMASSRRRVPPDAWRFDE